MCLACDMEAMWFAVMEARANAAAEGETTEVQPEERTTLLAPTEPNEAATLLPPPERGRVGEGVAGGTYEAGGGARRESEDPHSNPPPEEGGGSKSSRRFACEETSAE